MACRRQCSTAMLSLLTRCMLIACTVVWQAAAGEDKPTYVDRILGDIAQPISFTTEITQPLTVPETAVATAQAAQATQTARKDLGKVVERSVAGCTNVLISSWCTAWKNAGYCKDGYVYDDNKGSGSRSVKGYWCAATCDGCASGGLGAPGRTGYIKNILDRTNQERRKNGLQPLCLNSKLNSAAQAHSAEQAKFRTMTHSSRNGDNVARRVSKAGFRWSSLGENVARGYTTSAGVMDAWMKSSGHRANILNRSFRYLGVGLSYASNGEPYWTTNMAYGQNERCA